MKKNAVAIVVLVIGVVLGAYYYIGQKIENYYREGITMIGNQYPYTVKNIEYSKGFFSSKAVTRVLLNMPGTAVDDVNSGNQLPEEFFIDLHHTFFHGPLFVGSMMERSPGFMASVTHMRLNGEAEKIMADMFKENEPMVLTSFTGFNRATDVKIESASIDQGEMKGGTVFSIEKLKGKVHVSADGRTFQAAVDWPGMSIDNGDKGSLRISGVSVVSDQTSKNGIFWLGKNTVKLSEMNVASPENKAMKRFEIKNFDMETEVREAETLINTTSALTFDQIKIDNGDYGPGVLTIHLLNLEEDALLKLSELGKEIRMKQAVSGPDMGTDASGIYYSKVMELLPRLLNYGPVLEIKDLHFQSPGGTLKGNAKAIVNEGSSRLLSNPLTMMSALTVNINLDVPLKLIENTLFAPQVLGLSAGGMITIENDVALIRIEFADSQLSLNGKPLPLKF